MNLIFVYGTLKRGYGNHRIMEQGNAMFLREDAAPGIVYGPFPYARPSDNPEDWIKGELYEVDDRLLARLDRLEGHPDYYTRTKVRLFSGERAEIYYYSRPLIGNSRPCEGNEWGGAKEWR
jgi:gamma-glutamylaminecyclotransferase